MKKVVPLVTLLFAAGLLLSACSTINQIFHPTPPPPPIQENANWKLEILKIEKYTEPLKFTCSDCDPNSLHSFLSLQEKNAYVKVTVKVINQSNQALTVPDVKIGLMLVSLIYGCGGLTVAGTDFCLPSGMIRNGKNYVNYGVDTPDFINYLSFEPNTPDGEIVDFIFIVKNSSRYEEFYFDSVPPLYIQKDKTDHPRRMTVSETRGNTPVNLI